MQSILQNITIRMIPCVGESIGLTQLVFKHLNYFCEPIIRIFRIFGSYFIIMDIITTLYGNPKTVFTLPETALLLNEQNFVSLSKRLNYYVKTGRLLNLRKGIYSQPPYNREELACCIFAPAYISLEYVLQKAGVVFQFDSRITLVSYLSRTIEVDRQMYSFRKIKNQTLINTKGVLRLENGVNMATPERAFLDLLYLNDDYFFDNLKPLDRQLIQDLLPAYNSKALIKKVQKQFKND